MRLDYFFRALDIPGCSLVSGRDLIRSALSTSTGTEALSGFVNSSIMNGWRTGENTCAGFVRPTSLPNFLQANVAFVERPMRMLRLPRGGKSPTVSFALSAPKGWRLARFAAYFQIDEQDVFDNMDMGVLQLALNEMGAAAKRLIPDLVYASLLQNPLLGDGEPVFRTERGNFASGGGSALDETSLDAGLAAIAAQTQFDIPAGDDAGDPIHMNLVPRNLVVPPEKIGIARRLAHKMSLPSGGDLKVVSESRLSADVVDPMSDGVIGGNGKNWLLTTDQVQAAGILLGYRDGKSEPTVESFALDNGEWGWGYSINFDVGAAIVDGKPLYWSQGE